MFAGKLQDNRLSPVRLFEGSKDLTVSLLLLLDFQRLCGGRHFPAVAGDLTCGIHQIFETCRRDASHVGMSGYSHCAQVA